MAAALEACASLPEGSFIMLCSCALSHVPHVFLSLRCGKPTMTLCKECRALGVDASGVAHKQPPACAVRLQPHERCYVTIALDCRDNEHRRHAAVLLYYIWRSIQDMESVVEGASYRRTQS